MGWGEGGETGEFGVEVGSERAVDLRFIKSFRDEGLSEDCNGTRSIRGGGGGVGRTGFLVRSPGSFGRRRVGAGRKGCQAKE